MNAIVISKVVQASASIDAIAPDVREQGPRRRDGGSVPHEAPVVDSVAVSDTGKQVARGGGGDPAFSDPGRFITDHMGPPYLRSGHLGPVWVMISSSTRAWAG